MTRRTHDENRDGAADKAAPEPVDPELIDDLGAEFELRGDVMDSELEAALAEAAEMRDAVLRAQADLDNFRKRISSGKMSASAPQSASSRS
jgi:molecular chaperone GrpE (heat shock protein)